ncbi:MAG: IS256 family transposase, partial [Lachnospiraceae bacterium]|nr:IS256 family transposase [Lachnospiraceae bacterium]
RSNVIGVFPNEASLNRIIGSVLIELNDAYMVERRIQLSQKQMELLDKCTSELIMLAKEQQKLLVA